MRKASFIAIPLLVISAIVLTAVAALAASVEVIPSSSNVFVVQASGLNNIGGIDVTITYDKGALRNPKINQGSLITSGSMFIPNGNTPGVIRIAMVNAAGFNPSGIIATLTFEKIGISQKPITSVVPHLSYLEGKSVDDKDVTASFTNPSAEAGSSGSGDSGSSGSGSSGSGSVDSGSNGSGSKSTTIGPTTGGTTTTTGTWLGTVTMPGQEQDRPKETAKPEEPVQYQAEEPRVVASIPREPETPAAKREEAKPGEKKFVPHKSLLQQIREWKEPVTPQSLLGLFNAFTVPGARQEPEVALSDGKTKVKVYIDLPAVGKQSPNFALKGAKLISLKNEEKDRWVLEALPVKNSNDVKITALQDNVMTEIPLAVAQPMAATAVTKDGKLDPAAFALFLKERGTDKAPQFDLNGDKTRNYIDDYIFTANYIVKNGIKKTAAGAANKGAENAKTPAKAPAKPAAGK